MHKITLSSLSLSRELPQKVIKPKHTYLHRYCDILMDGVTDTLLPRSHVTLCVIQSSRGIVGGR